MQRKPDAVSELQAERLHLTRKTELIGLRPDARDSIGRHARTNQLDRCIYPLARLLVRVALACRCTSDVERAVIARAISVEGAHDIEKRLIARPDQTVREIVRMWIAALAGDGVDRLDVVGPEVVELLRRQRHDLILANARLQRLRDVLICRI